MIRRYFLLPVFALTSFAGARSVCRRQQLKRVCGQQKAPSPSLNHQKLYATFRLPVGDVFR